VLPIFLSENKARLEYNRIFPLSLSSGLIDEANGDDHHNLCTSSNASVPIDLYEHAGCFTTSLYENPTTERQPPADPKLPLSDDKRTGRKAVSVGEWSALTLA